MLKRFTAGNARFNVPNEGITLLNRLRKVGINNVYLTENGISFSTSLGNTTAVKNILGKRQYVVKNNRNIFGFLDFFYKRPALVIAVMVCLVSFIVLDQFAFRVRIQGLAGYEQAKVNAFLQERGIRTFTPKRTVRNDDIALDLIRQFDFVAHAFISVQRSTINVAIHRAENVTSNIPCSDIISTHDGVIGGIVVFSGTANVMVGDVVQAGDILVTGTRPMAIVTITNGTEIVAVINSFEDLNNV